MKWMVKGKVEMWVSGDIEMVEEVMVDGYEMEKDGEWRGGVREGRCGGKIV